MDLHIRNILFPPLFTIINDIYSNINILYGRELLIPSSGTRTRNYMDRDTEKIGNMKNSKQLIC